jgi:hypothetical protein
VTVHLLPALRRLAAHPAVVLGGLNLVRALGVGGIPVVLASVIRLPNLVWRNSHEAIWDSDGGINAPASVGSLVMVENIISSANTQLNHIFIEFGSVAGASSLHHDLFLGTARIKWATATAVNLSTFKSPKSRLGRNAQEV